MRDFAGISVPDAYMQMMDKAYQGEVHEVEYPVRHYVNEQRQFVSAFPIAEDVVGRQTVQGGEIHKKCLVYLPPGYEQKKQTETYPVLYLLHGVGGDHHEWLMGAGQESGRYCLFSMFDHLIHHGEMDPMIIVFPNGRSSVHAEDRAFTTEGINILGFYYFDYELRYDLIPFIERRYATTASASAGADSQTTLRHHREDRAIAGLSMGGMQVLNLIVGGYRCDATIYTGVDSPWGNGLSTTVRAPGMIDVFAYAGAFSNAPTSSTGDVLGQNLADGSDKLSMLYMSCGDADVLSMPNYEAALDGLSSLAGNNLERLYEVTIAQGVHDFGVWHHACYHFVQLYSQHRRANLQQERGK